jgi:hypothetical protein
MLPRYALRSLGADAGRTVQRLVFDGLLEVEQDGAFVGGPGVRPVPAPDAALGSGRIGALSRAALVYAQELVHLGPDTLALRLYAYGRCAVTPAERRRLTDPGAVDVACGTAAASPGASAVAAAWTPTSQPGRGGWRSWRSRRATGPAGRHKLYVSPQTQALPAAVEAVAGGLADVAGAVAFKVGRDAGGLQRPDKLVAYFDSLESLYAGSAVLRRELDGCPAQGVPFTAALTPDGLLSWGVDPPVESGLRTSWRAWLTRRLAEHLVQAAAGTGRGGDPPARLAVQRLAHDGVDTQRWVPTAGTYAEST